MRKLIACLLLVVVFATGCSSGFDREGAIDDFMADGLTRDQASCLVDGLLDEFGEDTLASDDDPTPEETEMTFEIMVTCFGN